MSNATIYVAGLVVVPVYLKTAKTFVGQEHRHHPPTVGHRWSLGVEDEEGRLRGVAICGRPLARGLDNGRRLEVLRLATDGTPNACSMLYGASARSGVAMGYARHDIVTYILASEPGTSLRAAGWVPQGYVTGREWDCPSRPRETANLGDKTRWHAALPPSPAGTPGTGQEGT